MTLDPDPHASRIVAALLAGAHGRNVRPVEIRREVNAAFTLTPPSIRAATAHVVIALVRLDAPPMQVTHAIATLGAVLAEVDPSVVTATARVVAVTMRPTSLVSDIVDTIGRVATALLDRSRL